MATRYDTFIAGTPDDNPDDELYEMMADRVDEQFPDHEGDERESMIYELMEEWKREQENMRYGL